MMYVPKLILVVGLFTLAPASANPSRAQVLDHTDPFPYDHDQGASIDESGIDGISLFNIPSDIGRNFSHLLSRDNLSPFLLGSMGTGLFSFLDERETFSEELSDHEDGSHETSPLGRVGEKMGNHFLVPGVISGIFVMGQFADNQKFESFSYALVQGYIVNNMLVTGLKYGVGRTRPNRYDNLSFPSGHASNAFTWATITSHYYGTKAAIPAYALASFITWSRVNMDAHYLSDVLFGATVGYVVGRTVTRTMDQRYHRSKITWYPTASRGGAGFVVSYSFGG